MPVSARVDAPHGGRYSDLPMRRPFAIAISLCLLLAGAASGEDWFDAYARGLEALKQGQGTKAAEWLERAIRKRPEPGSHVITYGTNRLDRYHPYLYLAEAHLLAGNPDAAIGAAVAADAFRLSTSAFTFPAMRSRSAAGSLPLSADRRSASRAASGLPASR